MKILVISKNKWSSRLKKHEEISKLMKTGGIQALFTTLHKDVGRPEVKNGRIDPEWYEKNISTIARREDYNHVIFQFSERDGKRWKLESGIRGHNIKDTDTLGESWVCSDEDSIVKFKNGTIRNKYMKTIPHEIAHELKNNGTTNLDIHLYDFKNEINNIEGFYKELNIMKWAKYLPEPYFSRITQGFAVPNPLYKVSGHHMGVDHGTQGKKDVPIFMPCDGMITRIIVDGVVGNCAVILSQDEKWAFRMAHMKDKPKVGTYKAGEQIGIVGNTGLSTSEHLHIDCHKDGVINMAKIKDRETIIKYCVDAHELVSKNI